MVGRLLLSARRSASFALLRPACGPAPSRSENTGCWRSRIVKKTATWVAADDEDDQIRFRKRDVRFKKKDSDGTRIIVFTY